MERRTLRNMLVFGGLLFALFIGWKLVTGVVFAVMGMLLKAVLPLAIVAGIGFWVYKSMFGNKSLSGSGNRRLPRL